MLIARNAGSHEGSANTWQFAASRAVDALRQERNASSLSARRGRAMKGRPQPAVRVMNKADGTRRFLSQQGHIAGGQTLGPQRFHDPLKRLLKKSVHGLFQADPRQMSAARARQINHLHD